MATISITIPDVFLPRVIDGMCGANFYQKTIPNPDDPKSNIPNPETKAAFCNRMIRQHIKACVLQWEGDQAANMARTSAAKEVDI